MDNLIKKIIKEELENSNDGSLDSEDNIDLPLDTDPTKGVVAPSKKVISDICEKEKFCKKQGPITFGQLRSIVESAQRKNLSYDVGEGFYKAIIRLFPWFFPQVAVAGFIGSSIRAFNKIIRPGLEDTRGYKNWWGKTMMRIMDTVEGDIPHEDPISKIFFISDGLLHMLDRKFKLKFTRYIAELAASKPDDEPVPEYFVENELRNWINQKFLLDPPLHPKTINESEGDGSLEWIKSVEDAPTWGQLLEMDGKSISLDPGDIIELRGNIDSGTGHQKYFDNIVIRISSISGWGGVVINHLGPEEVNEWLHVNDTDEYFLTDNDSDNLLVTNFNEIINKDKNLNESQEDDFAWVRDIEVDTDLTPAQIKIRYDAFPLEVVGPNMPRFRDIHWEGKKLILYVDHWEDFAELFVDNDSSQYGYMTKWLAEKVLAEDDYWEPHYDVVYDWMGQVWDIVTDNKGVYDRIVNYIQERYIGDSMSGNMTITLDGEEVELTQELFDSWVGDSNVLGEIINDVEEFNDLKNELTWAYDNAYNVATRDNVWKAAYGSLKDLFGEGEWTSFQNARGQTRHMLKFDVTDLVMDSVEKEIDNCLEDCKRYFDPERHVYDEHESESEAFEEFCTECHDFPFTEYGDFISFYRNYLYEWDELLNPRFDEYPDDKDIAEYFVEDVYGRI